MANNFPVFKNDREFSSIAAFTRSEITHIDGKPEVLLTTSVEPPPEIFVVLYETFFKFFPTGLYNGRPYESDF